MTFRKGDKVRLISSGKTGVVERHTNGEVVVRLAINGNYVWSKPDNVERLDK